MRYSNAKMLQIYFSLASQSVDLEAGANNLTITVKSFLLILTPKSFSSLVVKENSQHLITIASKSKITKLALDLQMDIFGDRVVFILQNYEMSLCA